LKPHAVVSLEESLGAVAKDAEQHQYDYTTFLLLLILPPSAAALEGLSKSQRKTYNKQVAQLKSISCSSTGLASIVLTTILDTNIHTRLRSCN